MLEKVSTIYGLVKDFAPFLKDKTQKMQLEAASEAFANRFYNNHVDNMVSENISFGALVSYCKEKKNVIISLSDGSTKELDKSAVLNHLYKGAEDASSAASNADTVMCHALVDGLVSLASEWVWNGTSDETKRVINEIVHRHYETQQTLEQILAEIKAGREDYYGWQGYAAWSYPKGGLKSDFLSDASNTIFKIDQKSVSIEDGIKYIRELLRNQNASVRLIGQSGVGKTRFVQALFEDEVGDIALDQATVLYTNGVSTPSPEPCSMAQKLIDKNKSCILIVDNCTPELHKSLTDLCSSPDSYIKLVTIEYDITEDRPHDTKVFKLESSSKEIIGKLIYERFPHLHKSVRKAIAERADGNYRIAIMLAETFEAEDTVAGFQNRDLFSKLFWQGGRENEGLRKIARVCSLVYSFRLEDVEGELTYLCRWIFSCQRAGGKKSLYFIHESRHPLNRLNGVFLLAFYSWSPKYARSFTIRPAFLL